VNREPVYAGAMFTSTDQQTKIEKTAQRAFLLIGVNEP